MNESKTQKNSLKDLAEEFLAQENVLREGGGKEGQERQKRLGRLTVRERLHHLLDDPNDFIELGLWAAYKMYSQWGELPCSLNPLKKFCVLREWLLKVVYPFYI
jgi:acetyl-CoA carboxylase carboxyltransferase component